MIKHHYKIGLVFSILFLCLNSWSTPVVEKEWTFLVFINGHNNLSPYGEMNIKDMEKVGSNENLNIVVDWGQENDVNNYRFKVEKSTDPSKVTSPMLVTTPNYDMGDYRNLIDFVSWGVKNFPAKHYFVAVWNHGSGWHLKQHLKRGMQVNDISFDDNTGNFITTEQLGVAMKEIKKIIGRNIDIYGSDACLMQMAEVAGEMKNEVDYIVGSEDLEPGEGWPYFPFLKAWADKKDISAKEISVLLSKEYLKAYSGGVYGQRNVTFSALEMKEFSNFLNSHYELSTYLKNLDSSAVQKIKASLKNVQGFYYYDYKDYGHFLQVLLQLDFEKDSAVINKAFQNLSRLVVTVDSSPHFSRATGLSIWMPIYSSSYMERYQNLIFNKDTGWSEFLKRLL